MPPGTRWSRGSTPYAPVQLRAACHGTRWLRLGRVHRPFGCNDTQDSGRFFRRAGAWLALFHSFAAGDPPGKPHCRRRSSGADRPGNHPAGRAGSPGRRKAGIKPTSCEELIADSVVAVGLLPPGLRTIGRRHPSHRRRGLRLDRHDKLNSGTTLNSDAMAPAMVADTAPTTNLPRVGADTSASANISDDYVGVHRLRDISGVTLRWTVRRDLLSSPYAKSFAPHTSITCCSSASGMTAPWATASSGR